MGNYGIMRYIIIEDNEIPVMTSTAEGVAYNEESVTLIDTKLNRFTIDGNHWDELNKEERL